MTSELRQFDAKIGPGDEDTLTVQYDADMTVDLKGRTWRLTRNPHRSQGVDIVLQGHPEPVYDIAEFSIIPRERESMRWGGPPIIYVLPFGADRGPLAVVLDVIPRDLERHVIPQVRERLSRYYREDELMEPAKRERMIVRAMELSCVWDEHAGCDECKCSPGFVITSDMEGEQIDIYAEVKEIEGPTQLTRAETQEDWVG